MSEGTLFKNSTFADWWMDGWMTSHWKDTYLPYSLFSCRKKLVWHSLVDKRLELLLFLLLCVNSERIGSLAHFIGTLLIFDAATAAAAYYLDVRRSFPLSCESPFADLSRSTWKMERETGLQNFAWSKRQGMCVIKVVKPNVTSKALNTGTVPSLIHSNRKKGTEIEHNIEAKLGGLTI